MKRIGKLLAMLLVLCMFCTSAFAGEAAATEGFELKVTASLEGSEAEQAGQFLANSFIKLAAVSGIFDAQVNFAGMDLLRLLAQTDGDNLTVAMPNVSENSYTISAQRVQELFGEVLEMISGQLEQGGISMDQLQDLSAPGFDQEEVTAAVAPYMQIFQQFIQENMQAASSAITLEKLGRTIENGTLMTVEPDAEAFCGLFTALADQLEKADGITSSLGAAEQTDSMELDEAADQLEQGFAQLPSVLRQTVEQIQQNGMGGKLILSIGLEGDNLVLIRLDVTNEGETEPAVCMGMETYTEETGMISVALFSDVDGEAYVLLATASQAGGTVTGTLQVSYNGAQMINVVYNWDLTRQSMLMIPYGTCVVTMQGLTLTLVVSDDGAGGNNHMLRLDGLEAMMGEGISAAVVNVNTSTNAEAEAPSGENIDISGYTLEELTGLAEELAGKYEEFMGSIFG